MSRARRNGAESAIDAGNGISEWLDVIAAIVGNVAVAVAVVAVVVTSRPREKTCLNGR